MAAIPSSVLATVLAIDYGAEFITASLMKPGLPFDVLLNKDSKRKISSAVGGKRGDRVFGGDAVQLVSLLVRASGHMSDITSGFEIPRGLVSLCKASAGGTI